MPWWLVIALVVLAGGLGAVIALFWLGHHMFRDW